MTKTAKKIGIVMGAVLVLAGAIVAAGGAAVLTTIGSDGKVSSGHKTFATSGSAIVVKSADLRRPDAVADLVGNPRVQIDLRSGKPLFIGVAPAKDVDRYLSGAATDAVSDLEIDPFKMTHHPQPGTKRPARPGAQAFWLATGTSALDWKATSDGERVVIMNADASHGVHAYGDAAVTVPHTTPIAWSLFGGGLLLVFGGVAVLLSARASAPSPRRSPAYSAAR
jgi:hypothetical protein